MQGKFGFLRTKSYWHRDCEVCRPGGLTLNTQAVLALACWFCLGAGATFGESRVTAREGPSGDFLEFEGQSHGQIVKHSLPLYRTGAIRYFSAGVGSEERQAEYPPFSLKLVFTAGGKPYLVGVDVLIQSVKGQAITISRDQVEGPWLFVDLPSGMYDISASYGEHKQALKGIKVVAGRQKTIHIRWADEAGASVKVPPQ